MNSKLLFSELEDTNFRVNNTWNLAGKLYTFDEPKIMAIINCTPDSFYEGSRNETTKSIEKSIELALSQGADFLDLGAYSSRPGANDVSINEEQRRLDKALTIVNKFSSQAPISVDTFRSEIADYSLNNGASIINDISGGIADKDMFEVVAKHRAAYIMMHMRGTPETMQSYCDYQNILTEIALFLSEQMKKAENAGIKDIAIDLGYGFSKTLEQNYYLLKNQKYFELFNRPILTGISRKSMIYKHLDLCPNEALNGTSFLHAIALQNGAKILRVHDVKEAKECVKLWEQLRNA